MEKNYNSQILVKGNESIGQKLENMGLEWPL